MQLFVVEWMHFMSDCAWEKWEGKLLRICNLIEVV